MRYLVTAQEMKAYDNNTIEHIGVPGLQLMENAAKALYEHICSLQYGKSILIVCGVGNNGGDGLALARLLTEDNYSVTVVILGDPDRGTESFKVELDRLGNLPVQYLFYKDFLHKSDERYDIIVDACFGVGLSREIVGDYAATIEKMNHLAGYKLAVDIPSGICATTGKVLGCAFRADTTITFAFEKVGMALYPGVIYSGHIIVADIGIGEESFEDCEPQIFTYTENPMELMPERVPYGNKGTFGKVLIIAGFETMVGAAILCAKAALQMGAGMVKVICAFENRSILQSVLPEVLYGSYKDIESSLLWADCVVIGPGLGKGEEAFQVLQKVLNDRRLPLVIDADAINLISAFEMLQDLLKNYEMPVVLTPHVGELARFAQSTVKDIKDKLLIVAKQLAKEYHSIIVSKDARTYVVAEDALVYLNTSGNCGMATAGSGDVLAGMIGALIGQGTDPYKAACLGVYLHGLAGDKARDIYTEYGVTASRLIENIRGFEDCSV